MSENLPILWDDKEDSPELKAYLEQFSNKYYFTAAEINQLRDAVNEMAVIQQSTFMGTAEPTATPAGTGNRYWTAVSPGTYANFGGVVVAANSLAIISVTAAGVYSVSQAALTIPLPENKINFWAAEAYPIGTQRNHLGKDWYLPTNAALSTDIPGTSSKWVERLSGYLKKENVLYYESGNFNLIFQQGQWSTVGYSVVNSSTTRICTVPFLIKKSDTLSITLPAGMQYGIAYFNDDLTVAITPPSWNTSATFTLGSTYNYIAIQLSYIAGGTIVPSNASTFIANGKLPYYGLNIKQSLGVATDAVVSQKVVNDLDLYYKNLLKYFDNGNLTLSFSQGIWDTLGQTSPSSNATRISTAPFLIKKGSSLSLTLPAGMQYSLAYFNDNLTLSEKATAWNTATNYTLGSVYNYATIQLSYIAGGNILPSNATAFSATGQVVVYGKNIVQTLGAKDDAVISQKSVTEQLNLISSGNGGVISSSVPMIYSNDNPFNAEANLLFKKAVTQRNIDSSVSDLIIVAGQSNADGRVVKANAPSWLVSSGYTIANYMMWNPTTSTFASYNLDTNNGSYGDNASCFSFDIFFAKAYLDANPTKKLYCIRQTVGGVPITELGFTGGGNRYYRWQPKTNLIAVGDLSMCSKLLEKVNNAITYSFSNSIKLKPAAILFHQGEGDADRSANGGVTAYKQNLSNLSSWLRGLFSAPTLPFLNAYIVGTYNANYPAINTIFNEMVVQDSYMKTVDMSSNYTTIGDGLHYNSAALEYMGNQMYSNYLSYNP